MTKVLIIGGGFAGCCAAELLSHKGYDITLVEQEGYLGGGCKTHLHGGHPYTYGPRHFLTRDEKLFDYLNKFVPMRRIEHEQYNFSYVHKDSNFYNYPFHRDDVDRMPERDRILAELEDLGRPEQARNLEEYMKHSLGATLYQKLVETYSKKMWKIDSPRELDSGDWGWRAWQPKGFVLRTGSRSAFSDAISAFPEKLNGYDDYFELATRNVQVQLGTWIEGYDVERHRVKIAGEWRTYDLIISTISPEILLNNAFGPLRWIGRDFLKLVLPIPEAFPPNVYFLYYTSDEPFTRVVEYKKFYQYESSSTLLVMEIPSFSNKLYPYPTAKDQALAQQYLDAMPKNVYSIGRAGIYRYIDVDDIIEHCMKLVEKI